MGYCGTDPKDIRNDFPSLCRRASHIRVTDQKYHHRHLPQYPLLPEHGYESLPSVRLLPESMRLPERPDHFPRYMPVCHQHLLVFPVLQKLRNFHCCSKYLCCFFHIFRVLYYGILSAVLFLSAFLYYNSVYFLLMFLPEVLLLLHRQPPQQ